MTLPAIVGNPRFYTNTGPHTLGTIAAAAGCATTESHILIAGLAALETAGSSEISFLGDQRHAAMLERTRAGAVIVPAAMRPRVPAGTAALIAADPFASWSLVAALFHPAPGSTAGIHASAIVADDAAIDATAEIGAHAVIGARAEIGARCTVGAGTVIGDGVVLGADCRIGPHVTISHAVLGARVYVYAGARIGQEGFGFTITPNGFLTAPQLGGVVIGDDVEVGANTTIDRGSLRDTVIGSGSRLDNLVQVAHNVRIGRHCAIAAQVGISGSAEIDDFVVIGGQAGIADHMHVGPKVRIGAQSGVMSEIAAGAVVVGSPARPAREVFREIAVVKRLSRRQCASGPETKGAD